MPRSPSPSESASPKSKATPLPNEIPEKDTSPLSPPLKSKSDASKLFRPKLAFAGIGKDKDKDKDGRRPSTIQFTPAAAEVEKRRESRIESKVEAPKLQRRMSSPPPPESYQRGVSFDTFDNRDATDFSLTLNYKHVSYHHTRRSRTFLCGTDQKDYSEFALEWLLDELVDDGDEIVCLRVVEKDSKIASDTSLEQKQYHDEAKKLLDQVIAKNQHDEKAISLIMELAVGKVEKIIQRMIEIYEPAVLVVGTRGRNLVGGMQALMPGSVSKYCLQQSPIPVIVVRPSTKRLKKKKKRQEDPSRRNYDHILELSGAKSGLLDKSAKQSPVGPLPDATEQEAEAVAQALGLQQGTTAADEGAPLSRVVSGRSDVTSGPESPSPNGPLSPDPLSVVMKSPTLENLDSPSASEESDQDEEEEEVEVESPGKSKVEERAGNATEAVVEEVLLPPKASAEEKEEADKG
ncbi:MAG: hypothetical protein Q9160_000101 [Pyrenula sp. 1 TL-2023]